jgi:hypothetical protein
VTDKISTERNDTILYYPLHDRSPWPKTFPVKHLHRRRVLGEAILL